MSKNKALFWAVRGKDDRLLIFAAKPVWNEEKGYWEVTGEDVGCWRGGLPYNLFPQITFENSPQQVQLGIVEEDTITKIRNLVDSHNGEVEVEGCLLFDYTTDSYIDVLKVYNDEGIYQVEVDHRNDCKIITHPLNWFPENDLESIFKYIIK